MEIHPIDLVISRTLSIVSNVSALVFLLMNLFLNNRASTNPEKQVNLNKMKPKGFLRVYPFILLSMNATILIIALLSSHFFRYIYTAPMYIVSICVLISSLYKRSEFSFSFTEAASLSLVFTILIGTTEDLLKLKYSFPNQIANDLSQLLLIATRYFISVFIILSSSILSVKLLFERMDFKERKIKTFSGPIAVHTNGMEAAITEHRLLIRIIRIPIAFLFDVGVSIALLARLVIVTVINPIIIIYIVIIRPIIIWLSTINDKKLLRTIFFFSMITSLSVVYIFTQSIYITDPRAENIYSFIASVLSIPYLASMLISRKIRHEREKDQQNIIY